MVDAGWSSHPGIRHLMFTSGHILFLGAGVLVLSGCTPEGYSASFDDWTALQLGASDKLVCATRHESDYFRLVLDDLGLRLDQRLVVGTSGGDPRGYTRSVSFQDSDGESIGQSGAIRQSAREVFERGRYIYEDISAYFPVAVENTDAKGIVTTIKVAKGSRSEDIKFGQAQNERSWSYVVVCSFEGLQL